MSTASTTKEDDLLNIVQDSRIDVSENIVSDALAEQAIPSVEAPSSQHPVVLGLFV